jgi:NTE family protein
VYRREPLDQLITDLIGERTFADLARPLIVNTVELNSGMQVLWGEPGLQHVAVADAVFASCALPGILPPREIGGRFYVDGAVVENLPVRAAATQGVGPIVAVDVGSTTALRAEVQEEGFAATYIRGLEIVMQTMMQTRLIGWTQPPVLLVHPRVEHVSMFAFEHNRELIEEGHRAMGAMLDSLERPLNAGLSGIFPHRRVRLRVDRSRCVGCGDCVARAPDVFRLDDDGRAEVVAPLQVWSPLDGDYVRNCPTYAISARLAEPAGSADPGAPG